MSNLLEKASILLTPTAYDNGKILSVKPIDGSGDFNFTRNSDATRVNSDGLIDRNPFQTNLPRIDYSPYSGAGTCGHWLFEPQSTNLLTYSEDFSQWTTEYFTANSETTIAPNGNTVNGYDFGDGYIFKDTAALDGSSSYTNSIYIKANKSATIGLRKGGASSGTDDVDINLTTSWQRFEATSVTSVTSNGRLLLDNRTIKGYGVSDLKVFIFAAQQEQQSFATSYIPTSGAISTRLQDAAFGAGSSDLINSTEGVLYGEIAVLEGQTNINRYITINDATDDNIVSIHFRNNALNQIRAIVKVGNSNQCDINYNAAGSTSFAKFALKWKVNDFAFWVNGVKIGDDLSGISFNANTLNNISFDSGQGNDNFFGKTKCLAVFKEALTDAELECLTSDETSFSSFNALALANNYTII